MSVFSEILGQTYKAPKVPREFPIELGIDLYNLDTSNKKVVEEVMKKYDLHGGPPHTLTTDEFIYTFKKMKIRSMIKRAIDGAMPTDEDLEVLTRYLIEHQRYERIQLNTVIYSNLPEDKVGRYIIEEDIDGYLYGDPLWLIYKWVYLVWNLAIPVSHCAAEDCDKIFIPATPSKPRQFCSKQCQHRVYMRNRREKVS